MLDFIRWCVNHTKVCNRRSFMPLNTKSLKIPLFLVLLLTAIISAQEATQPPQPPLATGYEPYQSHAEIALTIDIATEEIMLVTDALNVEAVAEAIRKASVERGVEVYIMTLAENTNADANYITSLALAGATVRLGPVEGTLMIIDRKLTITGPMIGTLATEYEVPTFVTKNEDFALYYANAFREVFINAEVYEPLQ